MPSQRFCPICETNAERFGPFGIVPRPDAVCPSCGSLERHRLLWLYLQRRTTFFSNPPRRALHIAPEPSLESKFRSFLGTRYLTGDLDASRVDMRVDITAMPFPDEHFDFIYCSHVLEHVPEDRKAMREFRRVLARDGLAILLVPIEPGLTVEDPAETDSGVRTRRFGHPDHVRQYGEDYPDRLAEAGFQVSRTAPADFLTSVEIERMGVTPAAGEIYACRR